MERLQKARNHACDMWQGVWINNRPENWRLQACDWVSEHVGSWYEETSWKPKVALFIFSTMFAACLGMNFFIMVLLPFGWILESVLLTWALALDQNPFNGEGRPLLWLRRADFWGVVQQYFPAALRQERPLDPKQAYVLVMYPHGIIGMSAWLHFASDSTHFSRNNGDLDIAIATVGVNFLVPLWREILLWLGFIDTSMDTLLAAINHKRSVCILAGGAAEALNAHPGTNDIILDKRKGFVRLALMTGTPLVPVFAFGENDLYYQLPNSQGSILRWLQEKALIYCKFALPLIMGEGILGLKYGFLPRTVPLLTVIGKPIEVTRNTSPNSDDIEKLHGVFKDALLDLYRKFEHQYNDMVSLVREKGSQTVQKVAAPSMETSSAAQEKEESEKSKEPSASMDESRVEPSEEETTENEPGVEKMKEKSKVLEEKMHEPSHHVPLRFVE